MIQALKVSKQVVAKPLKRLLIWVLQNVVLPNESILWIVQGVKLIKEKALVTVRRPDEINNDFELSQSRVGSFQ